VVRGLQSEIFFGECYRHFGSFWSCSWTIVDDCVHGSEIVVSNSIVDPPVMGMIVLKEGKAFGF
jgi:hypothetical protein